MTMQHTTSTSVSNLPIRSCRAKTRYREGKRDGWVSRLRSTRTVTALVALAIAAAAALTTPAYADGLIENVNGITLDEDGKVIRFTGLLIDKDGNVSKLLTRKDKPPRQLDFKN